MSWLLLAFGVILIAIGALLLRRVGTGYRVGRLLAAAPQASLQEVVELARASGTSGSHYVRCHGRISSDEEFPDEQDRPLVFRRQRLQTRESGERWQDVDEERLAVAFGIEDRQSFVAIDSQTLGDGLVVVPRESAGVVADLPPGRFPAAAGLAAGTSVRLRIEQVSAVEHATVAGVAHLDALGAPMLSAGLGRPLILTTLEPSAAIRLLAVGHRRGVILAAATLVGGLGAVAAGLVAIALGV